MYLLERIQPEVSITLVEHWEDLITWKFACSIKIIIASSAIGIPCTRILSLGSGSPSSINAIVFM